jgi:hypothetical protein
MTDDNRDDTGRWKQGGPSPNPGGMTRTQARIMRALEGMSEGAAQRLWELMHSSDEKVAVAAVSEYFKRMAPPPPKAAQPVAVNVNVDSAAAHLAAMRARIEARKVPAVVDVEPEATAPALPVRSSAPAGTNDAGGA